MFATLKHTQEGMNDDDNVIVMQLNNRNWNSIEYFMCTYRDGKWGKFYIKRFLNFI